MSRSTSRVMGLLLTAMLVGGLNSAAFANSSKPADFSVNLSDIILNAYSHHPQLKGMRAELQGTKENLIQARAQYLPELNLTGGLSVSDRRADLQDGSLFEQNTQPKDLSVRLNYTLYSGGRRELFRQGAILSVQSRQARYEDAALEIASDIIQDYLTLWSMTEQLKILNENVENLVSLEASISARFDYNDATRADLALIRGRLASAKALRSSVRAELNLARDGLYSKTGFLVQSPILPELAKTEILLDYDSLIELSRQRSPAIEASQLTEQSANINVQSEARKSLPTINLTASASTVRDSSPTIDRDDDLRAGISFSMPLYSGGSGKSNTRRALASYNAARFNTENIIRESDLRISQLWSRIQNGKSVVDAQIENVAANQDALNGIKRADEFDVATTQDVLEAEQGLLNARLSLTTSLMQQYLARLLVQLYTGELDVYDFE